MRKGARLALSMVMASLVVTVACGGSNVAEPTAASDTPSEPAATATPISWTQLTAGPLTNDLIASIAALSPQIGYGGGYAEFLDSGGPIDVISWAEASCAKKPVSYYTYLNWLNGHKRLYRGRKNDGFPLAVGMTVEEYSDDLDAHYAFVDDTNSTTFEGQSACGATLLSEFDAATVGDESWSATYDVNSQILPSASTANVTFRVGRIVATLFVVAQTAAEARSQLAAQVDPTIQTIEYILVNHDYPTALPTPSPTSNAPQAQAVPAQP